MTSQLRTAVIRFYQATDETKQAGLAGWFSKSAGYFPLWLIGHADLR